MQTEPRPQEIALRAYETFVPILGEWRHDEHPEPSLAATVGDKCAARILERDFRDIGVYLISSDDRGTPIELGVLAECIAELRQHATEGRGELHAEQLEHEFDQVKHRNAESSFLPPPTALNLPLCLRVARDLQRKGIEADAEKLKDLLVALTRRLVLQDGNATAHEITVAKEIDEFLTDMIRNAA